MSRFLAALRGEPVDVTPIWIMRQAGRYLPEYRATRAKARDFLTLCKTPELACEVTLQPIARLGVDAAILFSDILIPIEKMGIALTFEEGEGPRLQPVRDEAAIRALRVPEPEAELGYVLDAIKLIRQALDGKVPLIGFSGAPFTLLTYCVEGQTGKQFAETKKLLFTAPAAARALLDKLTDATIAYLAAQVRAGAQAVQLFDSWVGQLTVEDFRAFAAPYVARVIAALKPLAPVIYFANDAAHLHAEAARLGADALGIDWRTPIDEVRARVGGGVTLQGNLDPCVLFAPPSEIERRAADILRRAKGTRHVFNLGHGILPPTPPEHAQALVEIVHRIGR